MPYTKKNALRGGTARRPRRRTSMSRRFSRKRASVTNNKRSVVTLARAVSRNSAVLRAQRIWTDYQYYEEVPELPGFSVTLENDKWYAYPLTNFSRWGGVLRQDANVEDSHKCFIQRMQMNMRLELRDDQSVVNIWLVSPRRDQVSKLDDLAIFPQGGAITPLTERLDFIEGQEEAANIRLNPAIFKVHAVWYKTLVANRLDQAANLTENVGNPNTTWAKKQWNTRLNTMVRSPIGKRWQSVQFDQMPYYSKYYLLAYAHSEGSALGPVLTTDTLYTAINTP